MSVKSFAVPYPWLYNHRIAIAYCSCHRIMLGRMLRSRDNFKSYCDKGVFVIVGAAQFTLPPSRVWLPYAETINQFLGFTFINPANEQSSYHLHTIVLGGLIS